MDYKQLTPLTGEDDEWIDQSEASSQPTWQNKRCYSVFKDADGKAYNSDGRVFRRPDGDAYTNGDSRVEITFPYTPTIEYVDVEADPTI